MDFRQTFPLGGILLAIVTIVAMLVMGVDPIIAGAVFVVWIGSLFLATGRPPDLPRTIEEKPFSLPAMRKLIENSSTPVIITEKGNVAIANATARQMLGKHMIGQDARVVFRHPEAIALLSANRNGRAIVKGLVRRNDIWAINRQSVGDNMAVIELSNQTAEADISRAHTDFVANASHELRTPLASILGYVETLTESDDAIDAPTSQKFLSTIQREARRLQSLISDLMSLSRVEAEKHDLPQTIVQLGPLIERAARDAAGPNRWSRVNLALTTDATVRGDGQQLEQLVRNLVDNALKYGHSETPIEVTLDRARDKHARLTINDHGEGIGQEHLPHLTRRFYRTDPGRSRASGGTGLGLAIVKHIVERHRGRLDIESDLGKGTSVIVRIPLSTDRDHADSTDASPERNQQAEELS